MRLEALAGGNCNNGLHCGSSYLNLNNSPANANWNIGACTSYLLLVQQLNAPLSPTPLAVEILLSVEIKPFVGRV